MADIVMNVALGREAYYASLPGTNDALIVVPLEATGLEDDSVLRDYDTLAALLAGASNEQTTMGRKTLTSVTATVNDTDNRVDIDAADVAWTAASGNGVGALLVCYDPDTTASADANIVPISKHDFTLTPDGSDVTATIADLIRASSAA